MNIVQLMQYIISHPLNEGQAINSISRFVRWQIASRLIKNPIALPFVNDSRLLVRVGMTGATGNWYCGLHDPQEMSFVLHALRPSDLFVDAGANVGSYTVLAAGAVGAYTITIEPLPSTFSKLMDNIYLNDLVSLVDARHCGVSSRAGELHFTVDRDTMNRVALPGENVPTQIVPVTTLDDLCGERRPKILKLDVEGHEAEVLNGAPRLLGSPDLQAVLMETNELGRQFGSSDDSIIAKVLGYGFSACSYDWRTRTLSPALRGQKNTIFVRDITAMNALCGQAPRFTLINGSV